MDAWFDRFCRDINLKGAIILSGNTSDISKNSINRRYDYIINNIVAFLKEKTKFQNIIKWDRVDGIDNKLSKVQNIENNVEESKQNQNNAYDMGDDEEFNNSLPKYRGIEDFFNFLYSQINSKSSNCFILDYSDHIFSSNASLPENERALLSILLKTLRDSMNYNVLDSDFTTQKNCVIILTNKLSTIPSSFYINNADVSCIHIPTPTRTERESFINNNASLCTFDPALDDDKLNDFIDSLEGFTLKDIAQIMKLSNQLDTKLSFEKVINLYKYGEKTSPWEDLSRDKLSRIEDTLKKRVKGQDEAVDKVKEVIIRAFTGFAGLQHSAKQKKPKGVLFFVGPTGVGKTELAKSLAEFLFGDETACIRFDMSEFNHEHSDQRLVGAPPGYVGYEEGGQLTNAIKAKPFCVLLFDEIEKAHGRILDKFLQILEDGRLTDGKGETVSFSESVIIFTSNIGASNINYSIDKEDIKNQFLEAVRNHFTTELGRPELLNRIGDNIVPFNFISDYSFLVNIARAKFEPVRVFMKERYKADIIFTDEESSFTAISKSVNIQNGGRGVLNVLESKLINPLSDFVFNNFENIQGRTIKISQLNAKHSDFDFELE